MRLLVLLLTTMSKSFDAVEKYAKFGLNTGLSVTFDFVKTNISLLFLYSFLLFLISVQK